jgi:hypothetical protein
VTQQETPQKEMPVVPKPRALEWGAGLLFLGGMFTFIGFLAMFDENGGGNTFGIYLAIFGSALASLGFPLFLFGLLIHAIRVEGTAIRAGVVLPYK